MDDAAYRKKQAEYGRKGGKATFKKVGKKGMKRIAKIRWEKEAKKD